ncbi:MAG: VWA domain-containing protein [Maritimibacter sp.]|nr:VWA domain-containing protein [Maritimibacter sp.]
MARLRRIIQTLFVACLGIGATGTQAQTCAEWRDTSASFALDLSSSMSNMGYLEPARDFFNALVSQLLAAGAIDEARAYKFCGGTSAITNWSSNPASVVSQLTAPQLTCFPDGTALYNAVAIAGSTLSTRPQSNTRLMVLVTDGMHAPHPDNPLQHTPITAAAAFPTGAIGRLVHIGGSANSDLVAVEQIAQANGRDVLAVDATPNELNGLVAEIVALACANYAPNADIALSPAVLQLDVAAGNTSIAFDGRGSSDTETTATDLDYAWRVTRPDGTSFTRSSAEFDHDFDDSQLPDVQWSVELTVTDADGATDTTFTTFQVRGSPPTISVSGGDIDVLQDFVLSAEPEDDIDGGPISHRWVVDASPVNGQYDPGQSFNGHDVEFETVEGDIGDWTVTVTATDNEQLSVDETVTVRVNNLPPTIDLDGAQEIDVGSQLVVETLDLNDPDDADGGGLSFSWDIVQAPDGANPGAQSGVGSDAVLSFSTDDTEAGTYVFRLTVTDDEPAPFTEEVEDTIHVLVDGLPTADISGPTTADLFSGPVVLDGSGSEDPDSRCENDPTRCHSRIDNAPVEYISDGITSYAWSLTDIPVDAPDSYITGRVDDALGLDAFGETLEIPNLVLTPGDWTFALQIEDGEGNSAQAHHTITMVEPQTPPVALTDPFSARHTTDPSGLVLTDVGVSGGWSFDVDNLLTGEALAPGLGITSYNWQVLAAPQDCTDFPASGIGPGFLLYPAGTSIDLLCNGRWFLQLGVTDDDQPAQSDNALAVIEIGNCPQPICIDYPNTAYPLEASAHPLDVVVHYHLNAALYDDPESLEGVVARLDIFSQASATPVRTIFEPNPLPPQRNSFPTFYWDGLDNNAQPVDPGYYDLRVTMFGLAHSQAVAVALEPNAIILSVADPVLTAPSDDWAVREKLAAGQDRLDLSYEITGGAEYDTLVWRLYDQDDDIVHEATLPAADFGTISWDGQTDVGLIAAGTYQIELQTRRGGAVLGTSPKSELAILQIDLDVDTDRDGTIGPDDEAGEDTWNAASGAFFTVNLDADEGRTSDGTPTSDPISDTIHVDHQGQPTREDRSIGHPDDVDDITPLVVHAPGAPLPAGFSLHLVLAEREDAQSIHLFERIADGETAILGTIGDRPTAGGDPAPTEEEVSGWVDYTTGRFWDPTGGTGPQVDARTIGVEGMFFRFPDGPPPIAFDGEIDLSLELRDADGAEVWSDDVRLKVAPWMMISHAQPSSQIWAESGNWRFLNGAGPGTAGLDQSLQLQESFERTNQWFQDHAEIGYTQRPAAGPVHTILRMPYGNAGDPDIRQAGWPVRRLLNGTSGVFQLANNLHPSGSVNPGDFGGNLEVQPPSAEFPLGRIVVGDTMSEALVDFLEAQEVQPVVTLPTEWLHVGHVDEMIGFTNSPDELLVASPLLALEILDDIAPADRGRSVLFAKGAPPQDGTVQGASPTRLETGINHTLPGATVWEYVRIWADGGSEARGQVAHISARGNGWVDIDMVWDLPPGLVPESEALLPDDEISMWHLIHANEGFESHSAWVVPPEPGDRFVLVEDSQFWFRGRYSDGFPAIITVEEVLQDRNLIDFNEFMVEDLIADVVDLLTFEIAASITIRQVPVLFLGTLLEFDTGGTAFAYTPGLANMQPMNPQSAVPAPLQVFYPKPFGPVDAGGIDPFEIEAGLAYGPGLFVDDWDTFHRKFGEVHCGSNVVRIPPANWWMNLP